MHDTVRSSFVEAGWEHVLTIVTASRETSIELITVTDFPREKFKKLQKRAMDEIKKFCKAVTDE